MAPRTLDEIVGQEEIIGKGKLLRRLIESDKVASVILYCPPGTEKTVIARVIANSTKGHFEWLNVSIAKIDNIRKASLETIDSLPKNVASTCISMYVIETMSFEDKLYSEIEAMTKKNNIL